MLVVERLVPLPPAADSKGEVRVVPQGTTNARNIADVPVERAERRLELGSGRGRGKESKRRRPYDDEEATASGTTICMNREHQSHDDLLRRILCLKIRDHEHSLLLARIGSIMCLASL